MNGTYRNKEGYYFSEKKITLFFKSFTTSILFFIVLPPVAILDIHTLKAE